MAIYHPPTPPVFTGGAQPYGSRKLPPQIAAVPLNDPPYQQRERTFQQVAIASWASFPPNVSDPWSYTFIGGLAPLAPRKANPNDIRVPSDDPPYQHPGRTLAQIAVASYSTFPQWPPSIFEPSAYTFMGGIQPLTPNKLNPALISVSIDNPPFSHPNRTIQQIALASWAPLPPNIPDPWSYTFMGGRQPLAPPKLTPSITAVTVNNPPFGRRDRASRAAQVYAAWLAADVRLPEFLPASISGQVIARPGRAWGYVIS